MRGKIAIGLSCLALVIGALSLYEEWGRASTIMIFTGVVIIYARRLVELVIALMRKVGVPMRAQPPEASRDGVVEYFGLAMALSGLVIDLAKCTSLT